ncbi:MAG: hypothetical protein ABIR70_05560 [Bryobacteraceae bacterium]
MSGIDDRLRAAWADQPGPGTEIEMAVLAEFDRTVRSRRRSRWMMTAVTVAAGVVIAWIGARSPQVVREVAPVQEQAFTALPYVVQPAAFEQTEVLRMSVPVAELIAAGLPMQADPGTHVEADVVVGQDGRARAVRLVVPDPTIY